MTYTGMITKATLVKAETFQSKALGTTTDHFTRTGLYSVKADSVDGSTLYEAKAVVNEKKSYYLMRGGKHMQDLVNTRTTNQFTSYLEVINGSDRYTEMVLVTNNVEATDYFVQTAISVGFEVGVNFFVVVY